MSKLHWTNPCFPVLPFSCCCAQVLLALYFFLAGLLMHRHPYLWLLPVTSTACAALHAAVHVASRLALPFYALLHPTAQAWWCADAVHLAYSVAATAAAAAYVCVQPSALTIAGSAAAPLHDAIPSMLTCASTGFYAFQLWVLVKHRLFATSRVALLQCTLLLFLFGVAAYKGVHIAVLSACLLTEAGSVALLTRRMAALAGAKRAGLLLASSEKVAFGVFRWGPAVYGMLGGQRKLASRDALQAVGCVPTGSDPSLVGSQTDRRQMQTDVQLLLPNCVPVLASNALHAQCPNTLTQHLLPACSQGWGACTHNAARAVELQHLQQCRVLGPGSGWHGLLELHQLSQGTGRLQSQGAHGLSAAA